MKMSGGDVESLVKAWSTAFSEEVLEFAQPPEVNDIEVRGRRRIGKYGRGGG
jgi:hypothetical protein